MRSVWTSISEVAIDSVCVSASIVSCTVAAALVVRFFYSSNPSVSARYGREETHNPTMSCHDDILDILLLLTRRVQGGELAPQTCELAIDCSWIVEEAGLATD